MVLEDFIPKKIIRYDDGYVSMYEYGETDVLISRNIGINEDNLGEVDGIYNFNNGKLYSVSLNGNIISEPKNFDESYIFVNDKLNVYATNILMHNAENYACDERFVYDENEKLLNYYSVFFGDYRDNSINWKEGVHFKDGIFTGCTKHAVKSKKESTVNVEETITAQINGRYKRSKNTDMLVSDFGYSVFFD